MSCCHVICADLTFPEHVCIRVHEWNFHKAEYLAILNSDCGAHARKSMVCVAAL